MSFVYVLALLAGPALAQIKDGEIRAQEMFEEGKILYKEGRYTEALARMEAAVAFDRAPILLYNIGLCQEKLGRAREAIKAYAEFLKLEPTSKLRGKVEARIRELAQEAKLPGEVSVSSQPLGALVLIDGQEAGVTPRLFQVPPGRHIFQVVKEGFLPSTMELDVEAAMSYSLGPRLVAKPKKALPTTGNLVVEATVAEARVYLEGKDVGTVPYQAPRKPGRVGLRIEAAGYNPWMGSVDVVVGKTMKVMGSLTPLPPLTDWSPSAVSWVLMGAGLAALGGGGVLGGLASGQMADAEEEWDRAGKRVDLDEATRLYLTAEGLEDQAGTKALVANILYAAGGAVLAAGVLVWLLSPHEVERAPVSVGVGPGGALVGGRF